MVAKSKTEPTDRHELPHCYSCGLLLHGVDGRTSRGKKLKDAMMGNTCGIGRCGFCGKEDIGQIYCCDLERAKSYCAGRSVLWD